MLKMHIKKTQRKNKEATNIARRKSRMQREEKLRKLRKNSQISQREEKLRKMPHASARGRRHASKAEPRKSKC